MKINDWWGSGQPWNIGLVTGGGRFVVDVDPRHGGVETLTSLEMDYGPLPETLTMATGGGGQHFVLASPAGAPIRGSAGALGAGVDIRGEGNLIVAPPSRHHSGGSYSVLKDIPIAPAPAWLLSLIKRKVFSPAVLSANGQRFAKGERNDRLMREAGSLRRRGWDAKTIEAALLGINHTACDPPLTAIEVKQIAASAGRYPAGKISEVSAIDDWAEPESLGGALLTVDPFKAEMLPDSLRGYVCDVADRLGVPLDYPAVCLVTALAGVVGRRARITPKKNDTSWVEMGNLWGAIVGRPGTGKTPTLNACVKFVHAIEVRWNEDFKSRAHARAQAQAEYEVLFELWKKDLRKAKESGSAFPRMPEKPTFETPRTLIVNDATSEALHLIFSENPGGILMQRDELCAWLELFDRQGREGERQFALEVWSGNAVHKVARIGRGNIDVYGCCQSILGGFQPSRLRSYFADVLRGGAKDDGLIQRFSLLVWPDHRKDFINVDRAADAEAEAMVRRVFDAATELSFEEPLMFKFDEDAQWFFSESWLREMEDQIRTGDFDDMLVSHLEKYKKLIPTLAMLFQLADQLSGFCDSKREIHEKYAWLAADWGNYLSTHAQRLYGCFVSAELKAESLLADKLRRGELESPFSSREVYRNSWAGLTNQAEVQPALDALVDAGWLRAVEMPTLTRKKIRYYINPAIKSLRDD
jgi:putative DNA primase/helicase